MIDEDSNTNPEPDGNTTDWKFIYEIIYELLKQDSSPKSEKHELPPRNVSNSTEDKFCASVKHKIVYRDK